MSDIQLIKADDYKPITGQFVDDKGNPYSPFKVKIELEEENKNGTT